MDEEFDASISPDYTPLVPPNHNYFRRVHLCTELTNKANEHVICDNRLC